VYILEFLLTYVQGFHPILESPTPRPRRSAAPATSAAVNPCRHVAVFHLEPPSPLDSFPSRDKGFLRGGVRSGQGVAESGPTPPAVAGSGPSQRASRDGAVRPRLPQPAREERKRATPLPSSRPRGVLAARSGGGAAEIGGQGAAAAARVWLGRPSSARGDERSLSFGQFLLCFPTPLLD
jgi:hypothetical protein